MFHDVTNFKYILLHEILFGGQQEGREIKPKNPDEFLLKQEFVRRVTEKANLKAEEETASASTMKPYDYVRISK
jgi:hypothetical protein